MDREGEYAAKAQMVAQMQAGQPWQAAATSAGVQTSHTAAYRLLQRVRSKGARALMGGGWCYARLRFVVSL